MSRAEEDARLTCDEWARAVPVERKCREDVRATRRKALDVAAQAADPDATTSI